jgi:1-acyl-sn-glycerol-3-phosphate acyltransferase
MSDTRKHESVGAWTRSLPRAAQWLVRAARAVVAVAIRAAMRIGCRPEVSGRERLPQSGSFVLVANHASHLDTALLLSLLPLGSLDHAYPLAARDYFFESRTRTIATTVAFNVLPFDRDVPACHAFRVCRNLLAEDGTVLVVFPEGTRSADGRIGAFKPGAGFLLAGLDVPVVPCYVEGTHRAWPKGARLPRPHRVGVRIGRPRTYAHLERTKASALAIAEELRDAVLDLAEGALHDNDLRHRDRNDPHGGALGRYRDLLSRLAPARAAHTRRRPLSPRA